jgi:hypothetical protein
MAHKNVPRSALLQATIEALRNRPRTLTLLKISEDIGVKVSWLTDLSRVDPPEPGVNACVALYEYLTNSNITL